MTIPGARILLVEDEADLARTLRGNLVAEGHRVEWLREGRAALDRALKEEFDLIVLDVMLPGLDGFEICRRLRDRGHRVPVLFLTARSDPDDRIRGLEEGGDDYLTKPFKLRELLLRVGAILRRSDAGPGGERDRRVHFGDNRVDLSTYRGVDGRGRRHELTHKEAMILGLLDEREGEVVSRDLILDRVWGLEASPSRRTVDNFILRLRRRFEPDPASPRHFHTVHGAGYRFTRDPEP